MPLAFYIRHFLQILGLVLVTASANGQRADTAPPAFQVVEPTLNHLQNPLGLGKGPLRFSWKIESARRAVRQSAYRIELRQADAPPERDPTWDSGIVRSDNSSNVYYEGPPLASRGRYSWQVEVWTNDLSEGSAASPVAHFELGLLAEEDWTARWISAERDSETPDSRPAPLLRRSFNCEKPVVRARAYISGLGYFTMTLNGQPVSDHVLDPVVTQYDDRVSYLVFDLDNRIAQGENVIGISLGNGWFNQYTPSAWDFDSAPWRSNPRLIAQIELEFEDGTRSVIDSDESWRWRYGPIVSNGIRNGVVYDARREIDSWNRPGFDDSNWETARLVSPPEGNLVPQLMPPARVIDQLEPDWENRLSDTVTVYGFPVNTSGRAEIRISGSPGESVKLRYGERLNPDGTLDQKELSRFIRSGPTQTDRYVIGPSGKGAFEPNFMYHGFQYIQIETSSPQVRLESIVAKVIHTDLPAAGGFESSNVLLNELYAVTRNTYLTNFHSYPTDCPHREKIGWTGDGQLVMDFGLFNFNSVAAYRKWAEDMTDAQLPNGQVPGIVPTSGWGYTMGGQGPDPHGLRSGGYGPHWEGVSISLPWHMYLHTGDISILEQQYPTMQGYYRFLESRSEDGVLRIGIDDHKWIRLRTHAPIIATAYFYHFSQIMEKAARALGRESDADKYRKDQQPLKTAFNAAFLDEETGVYDNGSQTSQALALAFDLAPEALRDKVIDRLVDSIEATDGHPIAGVVGVRALTDALPKIGRSDLLYEMVTKRSMPSWGWWLDQGATTLWQNWDGSQSRNHIMFGSINDFLYKNLAGIQVDAEQPGYKRFLIKPEFISDLDHASAWHESPYGRIRSSWKRQGDGIRLSVEAPSNTSALIHLPSDLAASVQESGLALSTAEGVTELPDTDRHRVIRIESGKYSFDLLPFRDATDKRDN